MCVCGFYLFCHCIYHCAISSHFSVKITYSIHSICHELIFNNYVCHSLISNSCYLSLPHGQHIMFIISLYPITLYIYHTICYYRILLYSVMISPRQPFLMTSFAQKNVFKIKGPDKCKGNFVVIAVATDGLAPLDARPSGGPVMVKFLSHILTGLAPEMLIIY